MVPMLAPRAAIQWRQVSRYSRLLVITPGIRPVENRPSDDQKRVVSVEQALSYGADYIVVGRPIRDAADPRAAAELMQQQIAAAVVAPAPTG